MSKKLTVLFTPIDAFGHVNPCIGIGELLRQRGHRIVFAVDLQWKGRLTAQGFEEELVGDPTKANDDPSKELHDMITNTGILSYRDSYGKLVKFGNTFFLGMQMRARMINDQMQGIIEKVKPDVIITDNFVSVPAVHLSKIPVIMMIPTQPLYNGGTDQLPPSTSGYPIDDRSQWEKFNQEMKKIVGGDWPDFNKWMTSFGLPDLPPYKFIYNTELTIYCYPEELDYQGVNGWQRPSNWIRFDSFFRQGKDGFELPEKLKKRTGKLIFLSMGSIGCVDVELNKRLLGLLADSEYRVIVVKGPFADKYQEPDNAWGQAMVPQTRVLPLVDLVITHGGNNSLCEVFYFGKPMIIMPLFADQYDNGQRIVETGLGVRLDPFECTKEELIGAIDKLLNDQQLAQKLKKISERAHEEVKTAKVAKVIEDFVEKKSA